MTAPLISSLIGAVEMPRGIGLTGSNCSSISRSISPSIVGSTLIVTRSKGSSGLGLPLALHRQRHGQNEIVERVIDVDLIT